MLQGSHPPPMKVFNVFGNRYSGTLGKSFVAVRSRYGNYLRERVIPNDPRSEAQTEQRGRIPLANEAWSRLGPEEREAWNRRARAERRRGCDLFKSEHMTGVGGAGVVQAPGAPHRRSGAEGESGPPHNIAAKTTWSTSVPYPQDDMRRPAGHIFTEVTLTGPTGERQVLRLMVDTGATFSWLPEEVWRPLGIQATDTARLELVNRREVLRPMGEVRMELAGKAGTSPVVLGRKGEGGLLGVITLGNLRLEVDPVRGVIRPMRKAFAKATLAPA